MATGMAIIMVTETETETEMDMDMETARFFLEIGMHCLGCPSSRGETIEEACAVHGVDSNKLISDINAYLAAK
jgi:hybrid cluster-associated redox disulfide protein